MGGRINLGDCSGLGRLIAMVVEMGIDRCWNISQRLREVSKIGSFSESGAETAVRTLWSCYELRCFFVVVVRENVSGDNCSPEEIGIHKTVLLLFRFRLFRSFFRHLRSGRPLIPDLLPVKESWPGSCLL